MENGRTTEKEKDEAQSQEKALLETMGVVDFAATPEMCFYCFDTLVQHFNKENNLHKRKKSDYLTKIPNHDCALFVSWKKHKGRKEELRGCKGTHSSLPLHEGLKYFAICSATTDYRFDAVQELELKDLHCTVSLIFDFQIADHCFDWEIGIHGLRIDFRDNKNQERSATFLPEVMTQFGWTKKHTIERLVQKSGSNDALNYDEHGRPILEQLKTVRFRSSISNASFGEYKSNSV